MKQYNVRALPADLRATQADINDQLMIRAQVQSTCKPDSGAYH
jgi:hypothetical protein